MTYKRVTYFKIPWGEYRLTLSRACVIINNTALKNFILVNKKKKRIG